MTGIWHSIVAFFFPVIMLLINPSLWTEGTVSGGDQLGAFVVFNIFVIVHFKVKCINYLNFSSKNINIDSKNI
jgi:hypothetical protein